MAFPFSQRQLLLYVLLSEVNKIKPFELAHQMDHGASFLNDLVDIRFIWEVAIITHN
jgi:hypothetical protein